MEFTNEYDLPGEQPEQELDAQLAEAKAAQAAAEKRTAELERKHAAAPPPANGKPPAPAAGQVPGDPPAGMLERLSDPSVDWPTLEKEMRAAGFSDARPAGRQHGMRTLSRGVA